MRDWTPKKKEIDTGSNRKTPLSKVSEMPAIRFLSISERYAYPFASLSLKNVQLWWWGMIPVGVRFSTGMQYRSRRTFVRQLWRMTNSLSASNDRFRMISSALADDAVPIARLANPSNSARKSSVRCWASGVSLPRPSVRCRSASSIARASAQAASSGTAMYT